MLARNLLIKRETLGLVANASFGRGGSFRKKSYAFRSRDLVPVSSLCWPVVRSIKYVSRGFSLDESSWAIMRVKKTSPAQQGGAACACCVTHSRNSRVIAVCKHDLAPASVGGREQVLASASPRFSACPSRLSRVALRSAERRLRRPGCARSLLQPSRAPSRPEGARRYPDASPGRVSWHRFSFCSDRQQCLYSRPARRVN